MDLQPTGMWRKLSGTMSGKKTYNFKIHDSKNPKLPIITGAGSGIGRAVALALAEEQWALILTGRRNENLEETARLCAGNTQPGLAPQISPTLPMSGNSFLRPKKNFGRLDLLFNNAGVNAPSVPLEDLSFAEWKMVIDTNLTGAFLCTQEAFRLMKKQQPRGGRIINNGSISAQIPRPLSVAYTASKHGRYGSYPLHQSGRQST